MSIRHAAGPLAGLLLASALNAAALEAQEPAAGMGRTAADAEFIRSAQAAAPAHISDQATIARLEQGRLVTVRPGTNGFTCTLLPDPGNPPVCGDSAATQWLTAALTRAPRPTNTAPGIAYMGKGGTHYERPNGEIVMQAGPDTKVVDEPPHWMLLWPVDTTSGLPTRPNASGVYIMFAGTPYAHLMVHQDPARLKTSDD